MVIREDATPLFAVEVDGPQHTSDTLIKHHDGLKNSLCKKLGMPLIRMDAEFLRRVGAFSIIGWIIEMWLLYEDWQKAQQRVEVPIDEPFLFFAFPGYDPFAASRAFIHQQYQKGACITPVPEELHVIDPGKGMMMLAFIHITDEFTIIGQARCRSFMFPAIPSVGAHTLSQELAVVDAAEKFKRYLRGHYQPATREEVQAWRAREASWKDIIQFFDTI